MAGLPSLVVFGPQSKKPKVQTLERIRLFIHQEAALRPVVDAIRCLPKLWSFFSANDTRVMKLDPGIEGLQALSGWMATGETSFISNSTSAMVTLPLLAVIQTGQYFQLLRKQSINHEDLVQATERGAGIQGFCAGFLMAVAVSSSSSEANLVSRACNAIRLAVGIGIYSDLGVVSEADEQVTLVVRLKAKMQAQEIIESCPRVQIAAIIDQQTITVICPASALTSLKAYTTLHGLVTLPMHLTGKVHNPENIDLAARLRSLCHQDQDLMLEIESCIRTKLRSNASGELMLEGSATDQVIDTILTSQCQWHCIMTATAQDLMHTGRVSHTIAVFGLADCVPRTTFDDAGLKIIKIVGEEPAELPTFAASPLEAAKEPIRLPSVEPIAVVGMACRAPDADNVEELWNVISTGRSTMMEVPKTRIDMHGGYRASQDSKWIEGRKFYGNFITNIDAFDNAFFSMSSRESLALDPQQRLLLETTFQAVESSGYLRTHHRDDGDNVAVYIGASFLDYEEQSSTHPPSAYTSTGTIRAFLCGRLSHFFGWSGPSEVIDTACSSSLVAVNRACKALQAGECSMAIAGGVNLMTTATEFLNLGKGGFLSPTGQCKPFDQAADGYCRGEGAGVVVLKRLTQAQSNDDHILAVIPGIATNQGGLSATITIPHSPSQVALYKEVLRQAGMQPSQVSYIETHGTGTQAGDPSEIESVRQVFGGSERNNKVEIGSVKANIGHLETAAGIIGLIKGVLMLNKKTLPPLANFRVLNSKIADLAKDQIAISTSSKAWESQSRAMCVNSYGAAGSNAALLLCQAPKLQKISTPQCAENVTFPLIIEAQTKQGVQRYADALKRHLGTLGDRCKLGDLTLSLERRRRKQRFFWTNTFSSTENLIHSLSLSDKDIAEMQGESRKVILAFPGQSRRNIGCDKVLFDSCHIFRSIVHHCDSEIVRLGFPSILPSLFDSNPVSDVIVLQSGTFVLQYACARSWIECGLKVHAVVGHSFGELTAMAVSGVLSLQDALKFVTSRALLMKKHWEAGYGSMISVQASIEKVTHLIDSAVLDDSSLDIACYNSQESQVVSGSEASITRLIASMGSEIKHQRLDVSYAFHSRLCDTLSEDLMKVARSLRFCQPGILLESCTKESLYAITPSRLVQHTREPVFFCSAIQRLEKELGRCIWLEAGAGSSIIPMAKRATSSPADHLFLGLASRPGQDCMSQLSEVTTQLWRQGLSSTYWAFHSPRENGLKQIWLPPYQFERTRHWLPFIDRAMEVLKNQAVTDGKQPSESTRTPVKLVTPSDSEGRFIINTACQYFQSLVSGHAVLRQPLCPASMYMECATMAAQISSRSIEGMSLWFKDLTIDAPLGIDVERDTSIVLQEQSEELGWTFSVTSSPKNDPKIKAKSHGKGRFGFKQPGNDKRAQTTHYERLMKDRICSIRTASSTETLKNRRIYGMFSRIVNYGTILKGITSIILAEREAVAEIEMPPSISSLGSTAGSICDTATLDNFIQVAGVLLNTSDDCDTEEAFLAVGVEDVSTSISFNLADSRSWTVYASYTLTDEFRACADVAVLAKDQTLAATINGIHFAKLSFKKLQKLLESANKGPDGDTIKPKLEIMPVQSAAVSSGCEIVSAHADIDAPLRDLLASILEITDEIIPSDVHMVDLGLDSLAAAELADTLQSEFKVQSDLSDLPEMTYEDLRQLLGAVPDRIPSKPEPSHTTGSYHDVGHGSTNSSSTNSSSTNGYSPDVSGSSSLTPDGLSRKDNASSEADDSMTILSRSSLLFDRFASNRGFSDYWNVVSYRQDELMLAYIAEAFKTLAVDLWAMKPDDIMPSLQVLPKHDRVLQRLWQILERLGIITFRDFAVVRTSKVVSSTPAATILRELESAFPAYAGEFQLMSITGGRLAECLAGKADAARILFGSAQSQQILGQYYTHSPQLACSTDLLVEYLSQIISTRTIDGGIRILEIGGGFGGTTTPLVKLLDDVHRQVSYTFTDISPKLVKSAKATFSMHSWMDFQTLNLENDPLPSLQGKYDIVIGTNVVHATSDVVKTCIRIHSLLRADGIVALSEVTRKIDWYDVVFGLLEGWWCFKDGRDYPLQPGEFWLQCLEDAGFNKFAISGGYSAEARTQSIVLGRKTSQPPQCINSERQERSGHGFHEGYTQLAPSINEQTIDRGNPDAKSTRTFEVLTIPYKTVGALSILADIYYPQSREMINARPIALMIHGGGHMTLSRKDIRPWQTKHLLDRGMLPVSLDYRLCPEIDLVNGAMTDVRDAVAWARNDLPTIARSAGLLVDPHRIAVVGWSTGAMLAMSLAWTAPAAGIEPPNAILAFYGPSDYEAKVWQEPCSSGYPRPTMSTREIQSHLFQSPISYYDPTSKDATLGGLCPGDPRSELVFATFHSERMTQILMQGFKASDQKDDDTASHDFEESQVVEISPLAQIRAGKYHVPTFILHGTEDDVVPVSQSVEFEHALREQGVASGALVLEGKKHLYDLFVKPGTEEWERCVVPGYDFLAKWV